MKTQDKGKDWPHRGDPGFQQKRKEKIPHTGDTNSLDRCG